MKRFIVLLLQRFLTLLFACFLGIGIIWADVWLPVHPIVPAVYAQTVSTKPSISINETEKYAEIMPYWLWLVLPRLFPEYLDALGGYLSLGFEWEAGEEIPVGITKFKAKGIDLVALSCSDIDCNEEGRNLSSLPSKVNSERLMIPNLKFDRQRYHQFLVNCAQDPRFSASYILPAIEYNHRLSWLEKKRYRWSLIPNTKKQLLAQAINS
jgi:hypothetical protein